MTLKIEYEKIDKIILSKYYVTDEHIMLYIDRKCRDYFKVSDDLILFHPLVIMVNKEGKIICFEMNKTVSHWVVKSDLQVPEASYHRVSLVEDGIPEELAQFWTTPNYSTLFIESKSCFMKKKQAIRITDKVILEFCSDGVVSGLWLLDLPEAIRRTLAVNLHL